MPRFFRKALNLTALLGLSFGLLACAMHLKNSGSMAVSAKPENALRIASYNAHYILLNEKTGAWSVGDWQRRKGPMDDAFKAVDADIMGFQEMESFAHGDDGSTNLTLDYLLAQNPGYAAAATGDWREFPSTQPIFYRKDRLRVLDQGWFFFSNTPDVIYSRTFNGSYPAFTSWAKFARREGGKPFYVFDVHFEYKSRSNRRLSAQLVRDRIKPLTDKGEAVFLLGDLNARAGGEPLKLIAEAGLEFTPVSGATYHFNRGVNLFGAIDHLAKTPDISLLSGPFVLRQKFRGEWPTDHYPVFADYKLP